MTTPIIGVSNLGSALARHLVAGDERGALAAADEAHAKALADNCAASSAGQGAVPDAQRLHKATLANSSALVLVWTMAPFELPARTADHAHRLSGVHRCFVKETQGRP
jgi:Trk K+ transport system NAD-binding subunit